MVDVRGRRGKPIRPHTALVATWGSGGNLPPILAVAGLLAARGVDVRIMTSRATRAAAVERGFGTVPYPTVPDPDETVAYETAAPSLEAMAAGADLARDVLTLVRESGTDLLVADCMLPAALAAGQAAGVPTASVVHFPYLLARSLMARGGGAWTTDRPMLNATRRELGLRPTVSDLDAWESPDLLLAALPRWFDAPGGAPSHVVHAGPLRVRRAAGPESSFPDRVLLSFSTTVMERQEEVVATACAAVERAGLRGLLTLGPALRLDRGRVGRNVEVVDWADHDDVIPSCGAVVTHGGLGTTLRALAHGRPLLVLPLGRDQNFNATRVAELGAGITLSPPARAADLAEAIRRLLEDESYRRTAGELADALAADDPDARAGDAVFGLLTG